MKRIALIGLLAVGALTLPAAANAKALYDTPSHLMQKGVEQDALLMDLPWQIGCDGWEAGGEASYGAICRIHLTQGRRAHVYNGEGELYVDRKGPYIWYWSFSYEIKELSPGCRLENPEYESELAEAKEDEAEGIPIFVKPKPFFDCTHSTFKREWTAERPIHIH